MVNHGKSYDGSKAARDAKANELNQRRPETHNAKILKDLANLKIA